MTCARLWLLQGHFPRTRMVVFIGSFGLASWEALSAQHVVRFHMFSHGPGFVPSQVYPKVLASVKRCSPSVELLFLGGPVAGTPTSRFFP